MGQLNTDFMKAVENKQHTSARKMVESALNEILADKLNSRRQQIASSMFEEVDADEDPKTSSSSSEEEEVDESKKSKKKAGK